MPLLATEVQLSMTLLPSGHTPSFPVETFIIHELGLNQIYYSFALILLMKIVMCRQFH